MKDVLVIMSAYKRNYFREQIIAIKNQKGVNIKEIILWQNESHVDVSFLRKEGVKIIQSDINFKFHGRFTLPLLYDDIPYVAIFDDDTIPGNEWLQNAIRCVDEHNCIAGQNGRTYDKKKKQYVQKAFGDNGQIGNDTKVDLVGHCWVFKNEHLRNLWKQKQVTYETGEDIQFCLSSKYHLDIDSYVVKQTNKQNTGQLKNNYGGDKNASFRTLGERHNTLRCEIAEHWFKKIKEKNDSNKKSS